ncbi:hypothetical protein VTN77DRAFT_150 [Rasamsonia byssochlamydoides]|uniref:uncharacterized protein n=1 Tax=Rasamsonia byssochlamydoides TaxID=89139 RepID=UPI0037426A95
MATTPPPPSTLRPPPTPKHGAGYYSYDPYPTRHSARLASQRASRDLHTTPPPSSPQQVRPGLTSTRKQTGTLSPPGSCSPRKKSSRGILPTLAVNDNPTLDTSDLSEAAHTSSRKTSSRSTTFTSTTSTAGMLPTPAKTPRKKAVEDPSTTARALFPSASMSSRAKKGKKYSGFSLESFHEDPSENHEKIEIFTDSRDRIPKLDESEENPFYKKPEDKRVSMNSSSRILRRRKVEEVKRSEEVEEALKREDGMLYVFRGKKMFRKFQDKEEEDSDDDDLGLLASRPDLIDDSVINTRVRPLTRSSIKPRVLFPHAHKPQTGDAPSTTADEEAATDIEDNAEDDENEEAANHMVDVDMDQSNVTPPVKSTVTTPASPGATGRSLRSRSGRATEHQNGTPSGPETKKGKRISPFDGWMRKKQTPSPAATEFNISKKRDADPTPSASGPATKKTRGN